MISGRGLLKTVVATRLLPIGLVIFASSMAIQQASGGDSRLSPPPKGPILVAFVISQEATMIDIAGPWEVFQDVMVEDRGPSMAEQMPFQLFTVSDTKNPIKFSGGMQVVPDYTFDDVPHPRIVVVPAQRGSSPKMMQWLQAMSTQSDVLMSVCTGAFKLGKAGVLKGKKATTHHDYYDRFQREFPDVILEKGRRFVQSDAIIFTAGGLSSGIDLALHIVELYFGRTVAQNTANYMEYEGKGWIHNGTALANASSEGKR